MRKWIGLLVNIFLFTACTNELPELKIEDDHSSATGILYIENQISTAGVITQQLITTKAAPELTELRVTLRDITGTGQHFHADFPADGIINNVPIGTYLCRVSNPVSYNTPKASYIGETYLTIKKDEVTHTTLELELQVPGINFIYDPSLEAAGLADVVPVVEFTNQFFSYLKFEGDLRHSIIYTLPDTRIILTVEKDGIPLLIGDSYFREFSLTSPVVYQYKISAGSTSILSASDAHATMEPVILITEYDRNNNNQ